MGKFKILSLNINQFEEQCQNSNRKNINNTILNNVDKIVDYIIEFIDNRENRILILHEVRYERNDRTKTGGYVKFKKDIEREGYTIYEIARPKNNIDKALFRTLAISKDSNIQITGFSQKYGVKKWARYIELCAVNNGHKEINILGVHVPTTRYTDENRYKAVDIKTIEEKSYFWSNIHLYAQEYKDKNAIIIGDFNTFLPGDSENATATSYLKNNLNILKNVGYYDAWREKNGLSKSEYTWFYYNEKYKTKSGRRLDYAFISKPLKEYLGKAYHDHTIRANGISDHSAILIELEL